MYLLQISETLNRQTEVYLIIKRFFFFFFLMIRLPNVFSSFHFGKTFSSVPLGKSFKIIQRYIGITGRESLSLAVFNSFRFVVITLGCWIYFVYLKCIYLFAYTVECKNFFLWLNRSNSICVCTWLFAPPQVICKSYVSLCLQVLWLTWKWKHVDDQIVCLPTIFQYLLFYSNGP